MENLTIWSKYTPLRINWYNFAVELVGKREADFIGFTHLGGGCYVALQKALTTWFESTTDHSWQMIVDVLEQMDDTEVTEFIIKSIKEKCLISVCILQLAYNIYIVVSSLDHRMLLAI